ncbi:cytochrome P450 [Iodidimonas sp. SYSU 1G8]|uniref:cytochrome P450 n=1 Tax=Iodidimonas sp. SYSU 1G8 TaxID=3133967 RepID=UPI0031FE7703
MSRTSYLNGIPGEAGLPLVGKSLELLRDPARVSKEMVSKYGKVYWSNAFGRTNVTLLGPEANEFVLMDRDRNFSSKGGWDPILARLFPNGLMLRDFEDHRAHRRIMQVAFKQPAMVNYVEKLNEGIHQGLSRWKAQGDFKFYNAIKQLTLNTAASVFLGMPLGPEADRLNQAFFDSVQASVSVIRRPIPGTRMWRGVQGRKFLEQYFRGQIPLRRGGQGSDMFTLLCNAVDEDGNSYTDDDIVDHMDFLMMAAHDTLTSSITTLIYQLCRHPDWQDAARRECAALQLAPDALPYEHLADLQIIEWCFKEALRMNPPVPSIPRRAVRDVQFGGYTIPAGTTVNISPGYTHKMPELWSNPHSFEPDRFSEQRAEDRKHKFAWVPFGGGAHMCIGLHFAYMQTKVFMYQLLLNYRFHLDDGYEADFQIMPIPKPKDGLPIHLRPLEDAA